MTVSARIPHDAYYTPEWCYQLLARRLHIPGGRWLEPSVGNGSIIRAVNRSDIEWDGFDVRPTLDPNSNICSFSQVDFLTVEPVLGKYVAIVGNPPYSLAQEFVEHALRFQPQRIALLLRLNFLGSAKRAALWSRSMPDIYVLPQRPSFTGKGTDSTEYAWFVWGGESIVPGGSEGSIQVLDVLSRTERARK